MKDTWTIETDTSYKGGNRRGGIVRGLKRGGIGVLG